VLDAVYLWAGQKYGLLEKVKALLSVCRRVTMSGLLKALMWERMME
jgi:hypothetical protein